MKRILIGALLAACLFLQVSPAGVAQEKPESHPVKERSRAAWRSVDEGFKVLRLWEVRGIGPRWPEIAVLQLSDSWEKRLEADPLGFLQKYAIFEKVDEVRGHFVLHLPPRAKRKAAAGDPYLTVVVHDLNTYAGFASFEVADIK